MAQTDLGVLSKRRINIVNIDELTSKCYQDNSHYRGKDKIRSKNR